MTVRIRPGGRPLWGSPLTIGRMVVRYLNHQRSLGRLAAVTIAHRRRTLRTFEASTPGVRLDRLNRRHVERWLASAGRTAATKRQYLTVVRSFARWCVDQEILSRDFTAGVPMPRLPRRIPRALTAAQVASVIAACETPRDLLCVLLMAQEGLRVGEVCHAETGDIDVARQVIKVRGKGSHERTLPISDETWAALIRCQPMRVAGPLLVNHHDEVSALNPHTVSLRVSYLMHEAAVPGSAHSLRHTAASDVMERSEDLLAVRDMLGHVSVSTTQLYLRNVNGSKLREVMAGRRYTNPIV